MNLKEKLKQTLSWTTVFAVVLWSVGLPMTTFIPEAKAAGGIDIMYLEESGGFTSNIHLNSSSVPEAILRITAFETQSGTNTIDSITVQIDNAWDCQMGSCSEAPFAITDLGSLTATANSGLSLWQDDGDATFDSASDTLLSDTSIPSAWTTVADPWDSSNNRWQTTFSSLDVTIPSTYNGLNLFVVARAENNIDASPLHKFQIIIPQNGIDVTVAAGSTLTDSPNEYEFMSPHNIVLGAEGSGDNMMYGAPFVISEIQTAGTGGADDDFVEIWNRSLEDMDISSWSLQYRGSEDANLTKVNLTGTIASSSYYLITNSGGYDDVTATATVEHTAFNLSPTGGTVFLVNHQNLLSAATIDDATSTIDKVAWGTGTNLHGEGTVAPAPASNGSLERKAFPDSSPTSMTTGAHSTMGSNEDTNNNSADFILRTTSDPQNEDDRELPTFSSSDRSVVINEVLYNTASSSSWIELYNASASAQSLDNWTLNVATSTTQVYTIPAETADLAADSFITIYWNQSGTNTATALYTGAKLGMSTVGGDITLKNSGATIIDYVQYGGSGKAGEAAAAGTSPSEWMSGDFVSNSNYAESIARRGTTGDDYNDSGDWMYMSTPSPGYPNTGGDSTDPNVVASVVLYDADSTYGLDGNDVVVTWTPSTTYDSTFDKYEIYLLPITASLDTASQNPYAEKYGQYINESDGTASSSQIFSGGNDYDMRYDSAGTALSDGDDYRAYIVAVDFAGNRSSAVSSAAATLTSDAGGDDSIPPMIDHMPVWTAKVGDDIALIARFGDDRSLSNPKVVWKRGAGAQPDLSSGTTETTCSHIASGIHNCVIPWNGAWAADDYIGYYLKASDTATTTYLGAYEQSWNETTIQSGATNLLLVAAASWGDGVGNSAVDLSGTVYDSSGAPLADAFFYVPGLGIEGMATSTTGTTTTAGAFTIADEKIPSGSWELVVFKTGYMDFRMPFFTNDTALNMYMGSGYMNTSASGGASISWTAPGEGMFGAPTDISCSSECMSNSITMGEMPIVIGFTAEMNSSTIDDPDASNSGSNIYITSDGNTKIAGKVSYVYDQSNGFNEARFYSSTALTANTFYTVVLTSNVQDANGTPIQSNRSTGNYEFGFTTMADGSSMWDGGYTDFGGGGMMMPPYVVGTNPTPGAYDVPIGAVLNVNFSEPMDPTSVSNNVKLYKITDESAWTLSEVTDKNVAITLDTATKKIATIAHDALDANATNNGWYEIRVMAGAKSQLGTWMGDPGSYGCTTAPDTCLQDYSWYQSSFQVAASADTTAPTVAGTYPSNNDGISNALTVDVAIPAIEIGFSEGMNPSTINASNITLKKGTTNISGTVSYDSMSNNARYSPSNALSASSVYTLTVTTSVTDLSGNAIAANETISFKTGSADSTAPQMMYANGDEYQVAVTFSEPMNSAPQTDTTNWAYSVLNPENYYVNALSATGSWSDTPTLTSPYSTATGDQVSGLSNISITYDATNQTATLKGFAFNSAPAFQIFIDNVKDKSGNEIANSGIRAKHAGDTDYDDSAGHGNGSRGPLQNSTDTYGMLGPGGGPGMMMGGAAGGPGMDMGMMGMFGAGAFPMNAMAGQTSSYMLDIPVTETLQDGMKIVLTFPTGFTVTNAVPDPYSPMNSDMNEWGDATVAFDTSFDSDGVEATTANIVTLKLDITGTPNSTVGHDSFKDFLHIDLKGIKNTSIPKDFGTSGYTVDIKTKSSDGALLESITTMPFFITEGGSDSLTVVVDCGNVDQDSGTMNVFLGSPMTGPMEAESTAFVNGVATSTFSSLISGEYMIFTDPFMTIGANNYLGKPMPDHVQVNGATSKNITIEQDSAGAGKTGITVDLTGDYSTGGVADDVDVFANSPKGFRVKTLSSVGNTVATTTLYLTEGDWMMGIGPAMPKGPMSGPPTMPDWMQPAMVNILVGIETATNRNLDLGTEATTANAEPVLLNVASTKNLKVGDVVTLATGAAAATTTITAMVADTSITITPAGNWSTLPSATDTITSVRESSSGANDSKVSFSISAQSLKNIKGYVVDDSGNGVGNAEVWAYQPQGFGGGHTTTDTAGKFTLKIGSNGIWTVGAHKPGMPGSREKSLDVRDNSVGTDGNTTADVYLNNTIISDADSDNTGTNPLRLKIKRPGYTISGSVLNASGQSVPYAPVWAYQPTSWGHADTMTDSSGNFILYVDAGTWRIEADAPGAGWMQYSPDVTITTASESNITLRPDSDTVWRDISGTITINGELQTYAPIRAVSFDSSGNYLGREYGGSTDSSGQYTISVPGTSVAETYNYYRVDMWTQDFGEVGLTYDQVANSPANIQISTLATTTADITIAAGSLNTITMVFANATANQEGYVNIEGVDMTDANNPKPTGYRKMMRIADLSVGGTVQLEDGDYLFFVDVPGLGSYIPDDGTSNPTGGRHTTKEDIVVSGDRDVDFTLPDASGGATVITISATVTGPASGQKDAWVWVGNPQTGFHTGQSASSTTGTVDIVVPTLSSGNYMVGCEKPGYISTNPTSIDGTASTSINFTLTAQDNTISGVIYADANSDNTYDSGEAVPNGWVWAENTSTGAKSHGPVDGTGAYSIGVTDGTWKIYGSADGYRESQYTESGLFATLSVSGASLTGKNIKLTADANWTNKSKSSSVTPASGGVVDDTAQNTTTGEASGTGVKMTIPPNALGSSNSSGNVSAQETSAVSATDSMKPFAGKGKNVTATDNSGTAITNLDNYMDMEMVLYKADVATNTEFIDMDKLKTMKIGYWDDTVSEWVNLPTTKKLYHKMDEDTDWTMYNGVASTTGFEAFVDDALGSSATLTDGTDYDDYKMVFTAQTNHLTVFALGSSPDGVAPSAPTALTQSTGSGTSVDLSWTAPTTNADDTALTDLYGYGIYRSTDGTTYSQVNTSAVTTTTYTDSTTTAFTSYYYKITAGDDDDTESAYSTAVQMCSTNTVSNGTVSATCAITCNSGYTQNGNTCEVNNSGAVIITGGGGGGGSSASTPSEDEETTAEETTEEITTTTEEVEETTQEITTVEEIVDKVTETAKAFTDKIVEIVSEATEVAKADINALLNKFGFKRDLAKEQVAVKKYVKKLIKDVKGFEKKHEYALTNFIAYGTDTTLILGEGERAGVVNSYKSAFGKMPKTNTEWSDVIKIANGRWPEETSAETEANATEAFKKIYKRNPDRSNPHDDAAVVVIAYGLRPANRNLDSEKAAIKSFRAIYGYDPVSAVAWDIVRAIAYSGATR